MGDLDDEKITRFPEEIPVTKSVRSSKKINRKLFYIALIVAIIAVSAVYVNSVYLQEKVEDIPLGLQIKNAIGLTYFIDPTNCYVWAVFENGNEDQYIIQSPPPDLTTYKGEILDCTSTKVSDTEYDVTIQKDPRVYLFFTDQQV